MMSLRSDRPQAIDILLRHRNSDDLLRTFFLLLMLSLGLVTANLATNTFFHGDVALTISTMLLLVLPLWAAADNRLMEVVNRNRFLELVVLTCIPCAEWSDGLLWRSARRLARLALPAYLLNLAWVLWVSPLVAATVASRGHGADWFGFFAQMSLEQMLHAILWLPLALCMLGLTCYAYQVRALYDVGRPGRETQAVVSMAPFIASGVALIAASAQDDVLVSVAAIGLCLLCLGVVRRMVVGRLTRLVLGQNDVYAEPVAAMRVSSLNPVVRREAARVSRHTFGGRLGVYLTRYGVPVVLIAVVCYLYSYDFAVSLDVAGAGCKEFILGALAIYALLSIVLTYEHLSHAVFDERSRGTAVLLETTPLSAETYLEGWMSWAVLNRLPGMAILYGFAIIEFLNHGLYLWLPDVVMLGVVTWLVIRCAAVSSILISAKDAGRLVAHVEFAVWLFWYLVLALGACAITLVAALLGGWDIGSYALVGAVAITALFYRSTVATAVRRLSGESGNVQFLDPWDTI